MPKSFLIRKLLELDDTYAQDKESVSQDAVVTSMYEHSAKMFFNCSKNIEEPNVVMPVIVSAKSLHPEYKTTRFPERKSMFYYPTTERCHCRECMTSTYYRSGYAYPPPSRKTPPIPDQGSMSPDSHQSLSSPNSSTDGSTEPFTCIYCSISFPQKSDFDSHMLDHKNDTSYRCYKCDRTFTWFGNFQKHMLSHGEAEGKLHPYFAYPNASEDDFLIRESNNTFKCGLCFKTFTRMSGLRTHIRMHSGQRPYKCDSCPLAFTTNRALKMHTRIHSGERPYKCLDCSKTFTRKDELQAHIYLHKGEKPYKCTECSSAFVRHGHLQRHMLTHAAEKPYKCKLCPKSFTQYRNLQTHMYKHTGERPYKCRYCGKGFTQYGTVQAHERTHTGKKPYPCTHCDKRFITSSHLRWHIKRHHGVTTVKTETKGEKTS